MFGGAGALYEGVVESQERWAGRRAEARRAFVEFQQMHPGASVEEYRSFVDSVTGGNSYLRGALPSDQIIEKMVQHRQQLEAQKRLTERIQMLSAQAQLAGQIDALVERQILDIDDDDKLLGGVAQALGFDPKDQNTASINQLVRSQYPQGLGSMRQRAQQQLFTENFPTIEKLVSNNPNLSDDEVLALVPGLSNAIKGPRRSLVREMITSSRDKVKAAVEKANREQLEEAVNQGMEQIKASGTYTLPALPEGMDVEARRRLDPLLQKYEEEQDLTERKNAIEAARSVANTWMTTPGLAEKVAADPATQLQLKEEMRQAAKANGFEMKDEDLNTVFAQVKAAGSYKLKTDEQTAFEKWSQQVDKVVEDPNSTISSLPAIPSFMVNPELRTQAEERRRIASQSIGNRAMQDKKKAEEASLTTFKADIQKAINNQDVTVETLPEMPTFTDPVLRDQAIAELTNARQIVATRNTRVDDEKSRTAVDEFTKGILGDQALMTRLMTNDFEPAAFQRYMVMQLAQHLGRTPRPDELSYVGTGIDNAIATLRSSELGKKVLAAEEEAKTQETAEVDNALKGLTGIISAKTADKEGNPTLATAVLNSVVNDHLFGPNSGFHPSPTATGIVEKYLTPEMVEKHGGNSFAIAQEITADPAFQRAAAEPNGDGAFAKGYVTGRRRADKAFVLASVPSDYETSVNEETQAAQAVLGELTSGTATPEDFVMAMQDIEIEIAEREAAAVQMLQRSARVSGDWSTTGEMTSDEVQSAVNRIRATSAKVRQDLAALKAQGEQAIREMGNKPVDRTPTASSPSRMPEPPTFMDRLKSDVKSAVKSKVNETLTLTPDPFEGEEGLGAPPAPYDPFAERRRLGIE